MNKPELPESSNIQVTENKPVDQGRRRLSKAALAAPVIATLAARPALACSVSGFMSGNTSPGHQDPRCDGYGCTPGFWKNNTKAWKVYSPGKCAEWQGPHCKQWDGGQPGTTLQEILPSTCVGYGGTYFTQVSATDTLMNIFNKGVGGGGKVTTEYADVCHYIAAILNAAASSTSYGSAVAEIQAGLCKAAQEGKINYYTTVLLAGLNERGCMFDAWGNCEKNFTRDPTGTTCIPVCPTGTHWDSINMKCVAN
jgi:hypothetical protein